MTTGEIGARLLKLSEEYRNSIELKGWGSDPHGRDYKYRSAEEIGADYEAAVLELVAKQPAPTT